ncbi:class I SAM-dependent methyltransferase [Nocardia sp. NPDC050712]|uniref:class I SAM-dependent DNA methyltransferase n=1 Tax=Nocardia sp. NPDC050712 TaxID=3155518 RepID=UPI0033F88EDD
MSPNRLPASYFENMYADAEDPWSFTTRWYEQRKRALTLAALPNPRYRNAFEPGCSIGTLTEHLATRCDRILATDLVSKPLETAAARLRRDPGNGRATVEFRVWALGDDWPAESFDLIVLSEVCYYLDRDALPAAIERAAAHLEPGGTLLGVHWRHPVPDYPLTGDEVHDIIATEPRLSRLAAYRDDDLRLEVYTTSEPAPRSVAQQAGLV